MGEREGAHGVGDGTSALQKIKVLTQQELTATKEILQSC